MKLISMVDFVLQECMLWDGYNLAEMCVNYANFLNQPLKLWMFVPCDEEGNVLVDTLDNRRDPLYSNPEYQQAKERVLFTYPDTHEFGLVDGVLTPTIDKWVAGTLNGATIQSLCGWDLTLTPNAIKQIGL